MQNVLVEDLEKMASAILSSLGASAAPADAVARSLVAANLAGVDSHGVAQLPRYAEKIRQRTLAPDAMPRVEPLSDAAAIVYGNHGFGQVTALRAVEALAEMTRKTGVASVVLRETNHIGRLGEYAERLACEGMIAMIVAGGGDRGGQVAPHGGCERMFGTNPIAWGVPTPDGFADLIIDFATAKVATGKILLARKTGEALPCGVLLDKEGRATTDPSDYYEGGALLPFGEHKGYGLMLVIEILANLFGGAAPLRSSDYAVGNPATMTAWKIDWFCEPRRFENLVGELCRSISASRPSDGFARVMLPGQSEAECREKRAKEGIPVPDEIWRELVALVG